MAAALGAPLAEFWLDHDLGRHPNGRRRDVMPLVAELVRAADAGGPYAIGRIVIHSSNPVGALVVRRALEGGGVRRGAASRTDLADEF